MNTKRKPYNTYTKEFKLEALRLMEQTDRPVSTIAMELGIRVNETADWSPVSVCEQAGELHRVALGRTIQSKRDAER